jgi:hypothetical protein
MQRYFCAAAALLLLYTSLRGIEYPQIWAATHSLFNYEFGLTKRSLRGGVYELFSCTSCYRYSFFFYTSNLVYFVNLLLLWVTACRVINTGNLTSQLLTLAFCASTGVVYLATTIGFGDHAGLLCALIALQIRSFYWRGGFILLGFSLAILIHEGNYILFLPVALASLLIETDAIKANAQLIVIAIIGALLTSLTALMGNSLLTPEEAVQLTSILQRSADFPVMHLATETLSTEGAASTAFMMGFLNRPYVQKAILISLLSSGPGIAILLLVTVMQLRHRAIPLAIKCLIPAAGISPYLMYLLGRDLNRWNAMACITAFLLFTLSVKSPERTSSAYQLPTSRALPVVALLLLIYNMLMPAPLLYKKYVDKNPPFAAVYEFIRTWPPAHDDFPRAPIHLD